MWGRYKESDVNLRWPEPNEVQRSKEVWEEEEQKALDVQAPLVTARKPSKSRSVMCIVTCQQLVKQQFGGDAL